MDASLKQNRPFFNLKAVKVKFKISFNVFQHCFKGVEILITTLLKQG